MNNNRKNHQILKILHLHHKSTNSALAIDKIESKMKIYDITLVSLLAELHDNSYIIVDSGYCELTRKGVNAYTGKEFLNKMWYRNGSYWLAIIAIIISIIALFRPN